MRVLFALAAAFWLTLPVAGVEIVDDDPSDADLALAGQSSGVHRWPYADLVGLTIVENEEHLEFALEVAGLATGDEDEQFHNTGFDIYMEFQGALYAISGGYNPTSGSVGASWTQENSGFGFYSYLDALVASVDPELPGFRFEVPHALILDTEGAKPIPGDMLRDLWVHSETFVDQVGQIYGSGLIEVRDRMPDDGFADVYYEVQHGLKQTGTAALASQAPVRISNGEATTFLFEVTAINLADVHDTFTFSVEGVPDGWTLTLPQTTVRLDSKETDVVPVLVTVPFNHAHGSFHPFTAKLASRSDPASVGQVELGVRYTKVPQPTGHHDTVYLHGMGTFQRFINTLTDSAIPEEEQTPAQGGGSCGFSGPNGSGSGQTVPLTPYLQTGIDVDAKGEGEAVFKLRADGPTGVSSFGGYFVLHDRDARQSSCMNSVPNDAILEVVRSEPVQFTEAGETEVRTVIRPVAGADYFQFDDRKQLTFLLGEFDAEGSTFTPPLAAYSIEVMEGSWFRLPLEEYHDPVDDYFEDLTGIELVTLQSQERFVNPGETVVFNVTAENTGKAAGTYALSLTGANTAWARVLGSGEVSIDAGKSREFAIAVTAPTDAVDGELADITLHARLLGDEAVGTLIRFLAEVDTDDDHPDETALAAELDGRLTAKESPAPALWLALLVALVARRATSKGRTKMPF